MQQVQSEQKAVAYAPARVTSRNYGYEMDFELVVPGFDAGGKCSLMRTAAECLLSSAPHSHGRIHTSIILIHLRASAAPASATETYQVTINNDSEAET